MAEDFATVGLVERPWDRAHRTKGAEIFGYFTASRFDPDGWRGEYPNPAFGRMTERDAAWAARILARFTPEHVAAAVRIGNFTNPEHERFLTRVLLERQRILLRRYFSKLSPLADIGFDASHLCAVDLARRSKVFEPKAFRYSASIERGRGNSAPVYVEPMEDGRACVELSATFDDGVRSSDDAPERYVVVRITNGTGSGPLAIHLYDLGRKRGLRLVGIERPLDS